MTAEDRVKVRELDFMITCLVKSANLYPRDERRVRIHQEVIQAALDLLNALQPSKLLQQLK